MLTLCAIRRKVVDTGECTTCCPLFDTAVGDMRRDTLARLLGVVAICILFSDFCTKKGSELAVLANGIKTSKPETY